MHAQSKTHLSVPSSSDAFDTNIPGLPFVYLQISAVSQAVGFSTPKIYAEIQAGRFPKGDLIFAQSRRWKSTDIAAWLAEQAANAEKREDELGAALKRKSDRAAAKSAASRRMKRGRDHAPA